MAKRHRPQWPPGIPLRRLIDMDRAQTVLPLPTGDGRWAWVQQVAERFGPTEDALRGAPGRPGGDRGRSQGTATGVASGADHLKRITESGQEEALRIITERQLGFGQPHDFELLMAIVLTVKIWTTTVISSTFVLSLGSNTLNTLSLSS